MRGRIWNSNVDVEIEGDDEDDILEQFYHDYPERRDEIIHMEWER